MPIWRILQEGKGLACGQTLLQLLRGRIEEVEAHNTAKVLMPPL